jgi:dTDP-4-dehydrorhamnose reductase
VERVLLTGVDTTIGVNLALAWKDRYELLGLYSHTPLHGSWLKTAAWDPAHASSLVPHLETWQPKSIVHCGRLAESCWEALGPVHELAREPATAAQLAELASHHGCRLTVLSSDAVFCGPRMFHDERCQPMATSQRGIHGRALERALEGTGTLVVRTHAYGWNFTGGPPSCAQRICQSLRRGQTPECDGRRYATPILVSDLAELLARAHDAQLRGLYHMAGAERTSMHRFVCELAASLGQDAIHVEVNGDPHAVEETSLSSRRARRDLATSTPLLRPGLERFVQQIEGPWAELIYPHFEPNRPQVAAA